MNMISKIRLVLAGVLLGVAVMFASPTATSIDPNTDLLELKKKAAYYEIKVKLESGEISLEEAQKMWLVKVKQFNKEEAK